MLTDKKKKTFLIVKDSYVLPSPAFPRKKSWKTNAGGHIEIFARICWLGFWYIVIKSWNVQGDGELCFKQISKILEMI